MRLDMVRRELAQGAEIVTALVAGVSPEEARVRPAPGAWSLLEVVCHLHDEEREDFRPRLDLVLHRPGRGVGPHRSRRVGHRAAVQRARSRPDAAGLPGRAGALARLAREPVRPRLEPRVPRGLGTCPAGGPITAGDLLASWAAHDLLHTRQLLELRRARLLAHTAPHRTQYAGDW